ncbi:MAG: tRNA (adenosine(37)-N6)-threonylcarbamoyltransferase complex ATPase subunit type 1 TsaE [Clostridia bacterium]|nr:tRNA (adenosine(37)-N6)-threonylcarbamoyltransferase complex ATPase subunit type 1 TsaE [Clostridia bacterium]
MAKDGISLKQKWVSLDKKKAGIHSAAYIAKLAMLTALSFILYAFVKFKLPMLFPSFLEIQISELPALLAGFSMGPVSGCLVIIFKCLIKFSMSSTGFVGEATDMLLGVAFVLPASLIYKYKKSIKSALIGLIVGTLVLTGVAMLVNRYISIPFYIQFLHIPFSGIVASVQSLYKDVNEENFYFYYLLVGVLPFNIFRCIIVGGITFAVYKPLSKILHWNGESWRKNEEAFAGGVFEVKSVEETFDLAEKLADSLKGGEIVLLNGDLGAGKTTFTKGLALALGVTEEVTSPTFTIMNVYSSGRLKLNHLDMYRVESSDELYELGVLEAIGEEGAVTVIEWNKVDDLEGKVISIDINSIGETEREFVIVVPSDEQNEENAPALEEPDEQNEEKNESNID